MDDDFFARLLNPEYRRAVLIELDYRQRDQGVPQKLSRYFIRRLEEALVFFDQHPRRCGEEIEALINDFGFMGYFDQTLERVRKGVGVCYQAMGYGDFARDQEWVA